MLVLTRKSGETIIIGDNIVITILNIKGNKTSVGIKAPRDVEVHREEIYKRIQAQLQQEKAKEQGKANQQKHDDEEKGK